MKHCLKIKMKELFGGPGEKNLRRTPHMKASSGICSERTKAAAGADNVVFPEIFFLSG
jgi:hypothetical protein